MILTNYIKAKLVLHWRMLFFGFEKIIQNENGKMLSLLLKYRNVGTSKRVIDGM